MIEPAGSAADSRSGDATVVARREQILWERVGDDVLILDLRSSRYLRLNRAGADLWELLDEGASADELEAALIARGAPSEDAPRDLETFLNVLAVEDLLRAW